MECENKVKFNWRRAHLKLHRNNEKQTKKESMMQNIKVTESKFLLTSESGWIFIACFQNINVRYFEILLKHLRFMFLSCSRIKETLPIRHRRATKHTTLFPCKILVNQTFPHEKIDNELWNIWPAPRIWQAALPRKTMETRWEIHFQTASQELRADWHLQQSSTSHSQTSSLGNPHVLFKSLSSRRPPMPHCVIWKDSV